MGSLNAAAAVAPSGMPKPNAGQYPSRETDWQPCQDGRVTLAERFADLVFGKPACESHNTATGYLGVHLAS